MAILSLESPIALNLLEKGIDSEEGSEEKKNKRRIGTMWMEPQSLFVFSEDVFTLMLHGIDEILSDVEPEESFLNSPLSIPVPPL